MRGILVSLFLLLASLVPGAAMAQASPLDCKGMGCCCNRQAGGDWPDCAKGYECRGQPGPPYAQVCVKKGSNPRTVLSIRPSQPARCEMPASARRETEPETAGTGCSGAGCCCNRQAGGDWPDCARGFECRRQTGPPHIQVCVKKGTRANAPLSLRPGEPVKCDMSSARRKPGKKKPKEQEARGAPGAGYPLCEGVAPSNRQVCNTLHRELIEYCFAVTPITVVNKRRYCTEHGARNLQGPVDESKNCGADPNCHAAIGIFLSDWLRQIRSQR